MSQNVLPRQALAGHHVTQELKPFEAAPLQVRTLTLAEAKSIGAQRHVALAGKHHAGVMHLGARQAGRFDLAEMIGAIVLVPDADARRRPVGADAVGDQQISRYAVSRLHFVGDGFDPIAVFLHGLAGVGVQRAWLGPGTAQAVQQFFAEVDRRHVLSRLRRLRLLFRFLLRQGVAEQGQLLGH